MMAYKIKKTKGGLWVAYKGRKIIGLHTKKSVLLKQLKK